MNGSTPHKARTLRLGICALLFSCLGFTPEPVQASKVQIVVTDEAGGAFQSALVILKSLDTNKEIFRALSDKEGKVPEVDLPPGLYRAIADFPFGFMKTKIREFLVAEVPRTVTLALPVKPIVNVQTLGSSIQPIQVLDQSDKPVVDALVIVRDENGAHEKWYHTDQSGEVRVTLDTELAVVIVVKPPHLVQQTVHEPANAAPFSTEALAVNNGHGATLPPIVIRIPAE